MMRQKQRRRTGTRTKNKVCLWNKVVCVAAGDLAREMLKPKVDAGEGGGIRRQRRLRPARQRKSDSGDDERHSQAHEQQAGQ